jgi:hypothetical protein
MKLTKLYPGAALKLHDEGVDVVSGFCRTREDIEIMMGTLTVKDVVDVPVNDDNGNPIEGFQGVFIHEFPASLDNMQMTLVTDETEEQITQRVKRIVPDGDFRPGWSTPWRC